MSRTCADYSPEEKLMFAKQGEASARAWLEEEKEEVYKLYMLYTSLKESLRLENSETRDRINNRFQNKMKKLRKMA